MDEVWCPYCNARADVSRVEYAMNPCWWQVFKRFKWACQGCGKSGYGAFKLSFREVELLNVACFVR